MVFAMNLAESEKEKKIEIKYVGSDSKLIEVPPGTNEIVDNNHSLSSLTIVTSNYIRLRTVLLIESNGPKLKIKKNSFFQFLGYTKKEIGSGTFMNEKPNNNVGNYKSRY